MRRIFRWLLKGLLIGGALLTILLIGASIALYPTIQKMDADVRKIIDMHQSLEVSHPMEFSRNALLGTSSIVFTQKAPYRTCAVS